MKDLILKKKKPKRIRKRRKTSVAREKRRTEQLEEKVTTLAKAIYCKIRA